MAPRLSLVIFLAVAAPACGAELSGSFPCSLPEPALPIVFFAEDHFAPTNPAADAALKGAKSGAFFALFEGHRDFGGPLRPAQAVELAHRDGGGGRARFFGLENSAATEYIDLWLITSHWKGKIPPRDRAAMLLSRATANRPNYRAAFEYLLQTGQIADAKAAELIRRELAACGRGLCGSAGQSMDEGLAAAVLEAGERARPALARILEREYDEERVGEIMKSLGPTADTQDEELGYMMEIRNRDYAKEVASRYCLAVAEKKPIVVVVGAEHAKGMQDFLGKWAGYKIAFPTFKTAEAGPRGDALALLGTWEKPPR